MSSPRPTIEVDNLNLSTRVWPNNEKIILYDEGARYSFKLGPCDNYWKWPWPAWIGLPNKTNVKEWLQLLDGWILFVMDPKDKDKVDQYVGAILPYM